MKGFHETLHAFLVPTRSMKNVKPLIACLVLAVLIQFLHARMNNALAKHGANADQQYLPPSAVALKMLSLGFDQLLADFYWLCFVQYMGDTEARKIDHYADAEKYADIVASLDPKFLKVYYFSAFIIGSEQHRPDLAAEIIDRGIAANQDNWYLPFIAGINQYLYAHDEVRAAKYYRMAAKFPDAPKWLGRQAEILEAKIPSLIKETNVWDSIYRSSSDSVVRERARAKLATLWLTVYKTSPSPEIRKRALQQLHELGIPELPRLE